MSALVPLHRLSNGTDHFYTVDATERDNAIARYGYTSEGVACYVSPDGVLPASDTVSLRDQIAAEVISAIITSNLMSETAPMRDMNRAAKRAYQYADAMIAAR